MINQTLIVGLGGFLGANARYWLGSWLANRFGPMFPWHTFIVNISGCFTLGLFMTLALHHTWDPRWRTAFAIGFVGSYTTFSTYEYESITLMSQGAAALAAANLVGSVIAGYAAVWAGMVAGRLLIGGA